jgi:hypothetical protein
VAGAGSQRDLAACDHPGALGPAELGGLEPGACEVLVYAHDPTNGNTGPDRTAFVAEVVR